MSTIPASEIVSVNPSVLAAGGDALDVIGLILTDSTRAPIGTVPSFPDAASVADYFGASSVEATLATTYFNGFNNATKRPGSLLFAQYNAEDAAAFLRGGDVSALTLTQLQAITGSLVVVVDGVTFTVTSYSLAAASSFSSAAGLIEAAIEAVAPAGASVTGSIGGHVTASAGATATGTGSGTNLTLTSVVGVVRPGDRVTGTGAPANTTIVSQTSGTTGSDGVYVTNNATTSSGASLTFSSNVLDVTAIVSGTLRPTDALSGSGVTSGSTVLAQLTGTAGSTGTYVLSAYQQFASTNVTALSTVLNVTAVGSGSLQVGSPLSGTGVTADTTITALGTGTGGTGTYTVSVGSTTASETITATAVTPTVAYDSTSGAFVLTSETTGEDSSMAFATGTTAAGLKLTSATGAVLSQGAAAAAPGTFMDGIVAVTTDWVTFMTAFQPDETDENTVKLAFAAWNSDQNNRYAYICWDTDQAPVASVPATGSLGYLLEQNGDSGTCLLDGDADSGWTETAAMDLAAFVCGSGASINFAQRNGRMTFAFKGQDGITGTVTDAETANNLGGDPQASGRGNGYNFYGAYGAANANFIWYQRGFVTGPFLWLDSYINQIWLNNSFQLALLQLLQNALSIPYSAAGNAMIEASLSDPIAAGLFFGAYAPGAISNAQAAEVNAQAGADIAGTLQTQGWYLQVLQASSVVRAARGSPPCTFWYLDRGSVQALSLSSVAVQ